MFGLVGMPLTVALREMFVWKNSYELALAAHLLHVKLLAETDGEQEVKLFIELF